MSVNIKLPVVEYRIIKCILMALKRSFNFNNFRFRIWILCNFPSFTIKISLEKLEIREEKWLNTSSLTLQIEESNFTIGCEPIILIHIALYELNNRST